MPELIRLHAHDVDAPVGGTRNKNALPEKRETQCAAARHEGGVGGGLGVIHGQKLKVHRRTGAFGKALRQKENTGKAQKRTDDGERIEVTLPAEVRCGVTPDHGRQSRSETENHRHVGHQFLCLRSAEKIADHGHADHHAAARKKALHETEKRDFGQSR